MKSPAAGRAAARTADAAPGEALLGECGRGDEVYESLCPLMCQLYRETPVWLRGALGPSLQPKSSEKTKPKLPRCLCENGQENLEVEQGRWKGLTHLPHKPLEEADSSLKRLKDIRVQNCHHDAFNPLCRPQGRMQPVRTCQFRVRERTRVCKDCNETHFSGSGWGCC